MSVALLVSTMGFTVSKHYCGNDFVDFAINTEAETCCDMDGNCCHTESEHFQLEEDFLGQYIVNEFQEYETDLSFLLVFAILDFELNENENSEVELSDLPPPPKIQTTLSLLQTYLC